MFKKYTIKKIIVTLIPLTKAAPYVSLKFLPRYISQRSASRRIYTPSCACLYSKTLPRSTNLLLSDVLPWEGSSGICDVPSLPYPPPPGVCSWKTSWNKQIYLYETLFLFRNGNLYGLTVTYRWVGQKILNCGSLPDNIFEKI